MELSERGFVMRWSRIKTVLLFLIIFFSMTTAGCSAVHNSEGNVDYQSQEVLLLRLYGNYAWGFQQDASIVDSNGAIYNVPDKYLPPDKSILSQDDWYERLVRVTENEESAGHISKDNLSLLRRLYGKIDEYTMEPYKEYESGGRDCGSFSLYLIYIDENGFTKYLRLCSYGDWVRSIDDKDIIRFANRMYRSGFY